MAAIQYYVCIVLLVCEVRHVGKVVKKCARGVTAEYKLTTVLSAHALFTHTAYQVSTCCGLSRFLF